MKQKHIPIFFAVDDNYVDFLVITIVSIKENASKSYIYDLYIMHTGLSSESREKLKKLADKTFKIQFVNMSLQMEAFASRLQTRDYYTLTTYYRLLIPDNFIFIDKALYLDCDIVVKGDISELYNVEIGKKLLGAVPDCSVQHIPEFMDYVDNGLEVPHEQYFNAGILIMNLRRMRFEQFTRQVVNLTKRVVYKIAQDQDLLNVICKDKVHYLDAKWNVMPLPFLPRFENPAIIHYNLIYKPWKRLSIIYEEYFWEYAAKANLMVPLMEKRVQLTPEQLEREEKGMQALIKVCSKEAKRSKYYTSAEKRNRKAEEEAIEASHNRERAAILAKIQEYEKAGTFDIDVENDPEYVPLRPHEVDYQHKKARTRRKNRRMMRFIFKYVDDLMKKGQVTIEETEGLENLKSIQGGAVLTLNHFNPFDSIPIHLLMKKEFKGKKLFKIIREGNYRYPGLYGRIFRNSYTLPLASNIDVMKEMMDGVTYWLNKDNFILIYPEQSMWWNYRKPKPLKIGGFRIAAKNNVPVVPMFITMHGTDHLDAEGYPLQAYKLHIGKPIYPEKDGNVNTESHRMLEETFKFMKETYERVYGIPLEYLKEEPKAEEKPASKADKK